MDKHHFNSESNPFCRINNSNSFLKNLQSSTSNNNKDINMKNIDLRLSTVKKFGNEIKQNYKIRVIPGIIDKKDLFLNKNKTLLNVKDLISNKIRKLKELSRDKKELKRNITNNQLGQICDKNNEIISNNNKSKITNQQIFIQSINNNNATREDFEFDKVEEHRNAEKAININFENDKSDLVEIKNKFLGSPKLRNTTPLIDNERELKQLHIDPNYINKNNYLIFGKNERKLDFKNKTSDKFFTEKSRSKNFSNVSSKHIKSNYELQSESKNHSQRSQSNQFIETYDKRINLKNKSAGSLSEFTLKNFNPESQVYFNSEYFDHIDNLYPIHRKKDYFIEPLRKVNSDKNKIVSLGSFGFSPNRKNKNSILHKMKNRESIEINRNINSSAREKNKLSFIFMNPQVMDFFEFESELNIKRRSMEKHESSVLFNNQDAVSKKDKLDSFRTQIKSGPGLINNSNSIYYNERSNSDKTSVNFRSKTLNNNNKTKPGFRNNNLNGDLTCFSNLKNDKNSDERVEIVKISREGKSDKYTSEKNINEINSNKFNSLSNTISDQNDNVIKSKNGMTSHNDNNAVYIEEENYYLMENQKATKGQTNLNKTNKDGIENIDFQDLNINLNFSQISYEDMCHNEGKSKENKIKSASTDFENENNFLGKKHNVKNYDDGSKKKNSIQHEESYYAKALDKLRSGEINNPLMIEKYVIKNLEKGNLLKLSNGKITYLPFQKSFDVEKIHFNFSNRNKSSNNNNINNNFNSTGGLSKNRFSQLGKSDGFRNFDLSKSKRSIILKK